MTVFDDEIDARAAANIGKGLFAPMWRHYVECLVIMSTTWPTVAFAFYSVCGTPYKLAVMRSARARLYPLHVFSGTALIGGFAHCLGNGQMIALRDILIGAAGVVLLCVGFTEKRKLRITGSLCEADVQSWISEQSDETRHSMPSR